MKPLHISKTGWGLIGLGLLLLLSWRWWGGGANPAPDQATFPAQRGTLQISVLEGGSIKPLESQEIKCEVRVGFQGAKILRIVEEGYQVTDADVAAGKVLVELDSSELEKQYLQQEIQFQSALASLTDAQKAFEIQLNQNVSDIKAAEQKARFALMDFQKFLGAELAGEIVDQLGLEATAADASEALPSSLIMKPTAAPVPDAASPAPPAESRSDEPAVVVVAAPAQAPGQPEASARTATPEPAGAPDSLSKVFNPLLADYTNALAHSLILDFSKPGWLEKLGDGEGKQKLRKLEDDLQVAQKEMGQAKITLEGTQRLHEKGFVTRTDLQRDEIASENSRLKVQTASTARDLFLKYEFAKTAEETLSKYVEAMRELDRARKAAVSKLAQAEAKLRSAQAQYNVQDRQLKDLEEQLSKCVIRARKTGLVVYGGSQDNVFFGGDEGIREGATVREHQAIITIPDMTQMGVQVKIHESYIKKVKKGLAARVTVDAFPDTLLEGEVEKVGVLPDSQNRWMNPDLKVYLTDIRIGGVYSWLKPGMSAKVEIFVDRLEDVLFIPLQCVVPENGKRYCYVRRGGEPQRREVETGQFNDEFIEIKRGLESGDLVMLNPPSRLIPGDEPGPVSPAAPVGPDGEQVAQAPSSP